MALSRLGVGALYFLTLWCVSGAGANIFYFNLAGANNKKEKRKTKSRIIDALLMFFFGIF